MAAARYVMNKNGQDGQLAKLRRQMDALLPALVTVGLLYAAYFVWRYGGLWTENDSAVFAKVIQETIHARSVLFPGQYSHGFGYPDWVSVLALSTGIPVPILSAYVMPFLGVILMVIGTYPAFSALTGRRGVGALGVLLVLAVPEVMFTVLRGNHEKMNVFLMSGALYALLNVVRSSATRQLALWIGVFCLCAFLNVAANDYFGVSFAAACTLMTAIAYTLHRRSRASTDLKTARRTVFARLVILTLCAWIIAGWVMVVLFPSSLYDLSLLAQALAQLRRLVLFLHTSSNPYAGLLEQWANPVVAHLMAMFRWVILGGSAAFWSSQVWAVIVRRRTLSVRNMVLLGLYTAFSLLVAVAIPIDFTGLSAGSNLEVRDYTYFALFAAPLLARGMARLVRRRRPRAGPRVDRAQAAGSWDKTGQVRSRAVGTALLLLIGWGLLKTTLDPVVSNNWIFYTESDLQAIQTFYQRSRHQLLWTGPDNRLVFVGETWEPLGAHGNHVEGYAAAAGTDDYLVSPAIQAAVRIAGVLAPGPVSGGAGGGGDRIYDDGAAQIYRSEPGSAFAP